VTLSHCDVRFYPDCVAKVGEEQLAGNNRIGTNKFVEENPSNSLRAL
jgi:hypothetical protein